MMHGQKYIKIFEAVVISLDKKCEKSLSNTEVEDSVVNAVMT